MTTSYYAAEAGDQSIVEQFTRLFGHRPTPHELEQYRRARAGLAAALPARIRRRAARMVTRL
ncbi:hypothetical protein [Nocardioides sp. CER19]|uniref:hypothetical protein n=1 Tax=Nocardioides sp. CER19 TaxID=3038538 RepID=UPI0024475386|nr:hypothetical protein [Nocardioides sp. CER19]MDH2416477.1 hypothetical protein [Nocardioides sp. CER19]